MKLAFAIAAAIALSPLSLSAATLTVTNVVGSWIDTNGGTSVDGKGTNQVSWGTPANQDKLQSGYAFVGKPSTDNVANTAFVMGVFTHDNNFLAMGSSITGATLRVAFTFFLDVAKDNPFTRVATFQFRHDETINDADPCKDGGVDGVGINENGCADIVTVRTNPRLSETFDIDGVTYVFNVTGFDVGRRFLTKENLSNNAEMVGRFTEEGNVAPVPLPAAGGLLLAALAGFGALSRLRRRAA